MSMNPEVKAKWIEALRSGRYQQGKYSLKRNDQFCCLGVLCDISKLSNWQSNIPSSTYFGESGMLPAQVIDWSGVASDVGIESLNHPLCILAGMNDNGKSFSEIADWIEANL